MNIQDYVVSENYIEEAEASLKRYEKASANLTSIEKSIRAGGEIGINYYKAYLEYIVADNEHMVSFLNFIKCAYDTCQYEKKLSLLNHAKVEKLSNAQSLLDAAFNKYYSYYEDLKILDNELEREIDKYKNIDFSVHHLELMRLHGFLAKIDQKHMIKANEIESYRNKELLPLIEHCEELCETVMKMDNDEPVVLS